MWQYTFDAKKGDRIFRYGIGIMPANRGFWWDYLNKQWCEDIPDGRASSHAPCKTFKAFKRHLRNHGEPLKDHPVLWSSRFIGHSITAHWVEG